MHRLPDPVFILLLPALCSWRLISPLPASCPTLREALAPQGIKGREEHEVRLQGSQTLSCSLGHCLGEGGRAGSCVLSPAVLPFDPRERPLHTLVFWSSSSCPAAQGPWGPAPLFCVLASHHSSRVWTTPAEFWARGSVLGWMLCGACVWVTGTAWPWRLGCLLYAWGHPWL